MKTYLISLAVGILVGFIYGLLKVRSPAPPVIALVGLAGMLIGEQLLPLGKQMLSGSSFVIAWRAAHCETHIFGALPGGPAKTDQLPSEEKKAS